MRDPGRQRAGRARRWARILLPLAASLVGLVTLRLVGPDVLSQRQLSEWIRPFGVWAPLVFVLFLAIRPVTLLPGQLFTALGGILFGTLMGSVYALLGSFLACCLTYLLAQKLGTRFMKRLAGDRYHALRTAARRHDFLVGLVMCLNPLVPTDVMVALSAASGARFWPTVLGVMLGTLPGTLLTAQFGSALSQGKTLMTVVSAAGLVLSLVLGVVVGRRGYRELRERRPAEQGGPGAEKPRSGRPPGPPESSGPSRRRRATVTLATFVGH